MDNLEEILFRLNGLAGMMRELHSGMKDRVPDDVRLAVFSATDCLEHIASDLEADLALISP